MARYRAVIIGAGRIGAGFNWHDLRYTHAGAYQALKDRVELVGIADPDPERLNAATEQWKVLGGMTAGKTIEMTQPDIVSICTAPDVQVRETILNYCVSAKVKGIWCEKPFVGRPRQIPTQVNYLRRADPVHQEIAEHQVTGKRLVVYGKDDIHTRCHFDDLVNFWGVDEFDYRVYNGPCAYLLTWRGVENGSEAQWFDNGGINPGECMKGMLKNLLDTLDGKDELWSPATR